MNREDIIRMAREATKEAPREDWNSTAWVFGDETLERFAALVASAERERIKQANAPEIERINAHIKELEDAVKAEREACAKVCDNRVTAYQYATDVWAQEHIDEARHLAKAIRARGQA